MPEQPKEYLRLQNNIGSSIDNATSLLKNGAKHSSMDDLTIQYNQQLQQGNYTGVIATLARQKDLRSGIKTYVMENKEDSTKTLVRDAREAKDLIIAPESYLMMVTNHARGAIQVIEDAFKRGEIKDEKTKNQAIKNIHQKLENFFKDSSPALGKSNEELKIEAQNKKNWPWEKKSIISKIESSSKQFNTSLVEECKKLGIEDSKDKIKLAKEFANLQDEHYHVATISKIGNGVVVESEAMNLGLTEKQKAMFKAIQECESTSDSTRLIANGENLEWFNGQPRWKQDFIKASAEEILKEEKVIPTQLRKELPLLRNSYTKSTYVDGSGKYENLGLVYQTTHSGTLTTKAKGDKKDLAQLSIDQLQLFSPNGKISLAIQTSPNNLSAEVDQADRKLILGSTEKGIFKSTTAFNFWRSIPGGRDLSGYKETIKSINSQLKDYGELSEEQKKAVASFKEAEKLVRSSSVFSFSVFDKNHKNSQINEHMGIATTKLKEAFPKIDIPNINISCASGKDRTQMVIIGATARAIAEKLGMSPKEVSEELAKSGNAQHLSGTNGGGSIGCFGQKPQTTKAGNKLIFSSSQNLFGQRTADMNKFKTEKKSILSNAKKYIMHMTSYITGGKKEEVKENNFIYVDTQERITQPNHVDDKIKVQGKISQSSLQEHHSDRFSPKKAIKAAGIMNMMTVTKGSIRSSEIPNSVKREEGRRH